MKIQEAVKLVASKFLYTPDNHKWFDRWRIMKEDSDGKLRGDCEDFSLTAMWYACDKSLLTFLWKVVITHQYKLYHCKTYANERHAIGYAEGLWFDNWTKEALPKQEFLGHTKHQIKYWYPIPLMIVPFIVGHITRKKL